MPLETSLDGGISWQWAPVLIELLVKYLGGNKILERLLFSHDRHEWKSLNSMKGCE